MLVLRLVLMLAITCERYGTSPLQIRKILGEESIGDEEESEMWNEAYFERFFGPDKPAEIIMPAMGPGDEDKGEDDPAGEDDAADDAAADEADKEGNEEVNEDDEADTEGPAEYTDYDASKEGKSSGHSWNIRGAQFFTEIIVTMCFIFF